MTQSIHTIIAIIIDSKYICQNYFENYNGEFKIGKFSSYNRTINEINNVCGLKICSKF